MTRDDLKTMLDYHYWARDRMLDAVASLSPDQFTKEMGNSFSSIRDTVGHLYSAEWAWHSRWTGVSPTAPLPMTMFPDVATIRGLWTEMEGKVRGFVEALDERDVSKVFEYKMVSGQPGATPFWQMLQHLVNHASYHRGQVTTMLRQIGAQPGKSMDMIAFYRERAAVNK